MYLRFCLNFSFFNDTASTEMYTTHNTLSLHDALPIYVLHHGAGEPLRDRVPVALHKHEGVHRSEEHTSELQSLCVISYDVFCLKKKHDEDVPLAATVQVAKRPYHPPN